MATIRGGNKLEAALRAISEKISQPATLKVGFLEGATYPDGMPVALVAAVNEFGGGHVPPRPYFRPMVEDKSPQWGAAIEQNLVAKNYDVGATLALAGDGIKGQLQQSIRDTNSPPLAPATIKRKGFDKPLVDTGHMLNSVDYEVET